MGWKGGARNANGEGERSINTLNRKHPHKIRLGRPSRRWKENVKLDLKETGGRVWTQFISLTVGAPQGISWVLRQ
jgi:hypothetical protein